MIFSAEEFVRLRRSRYPEEYRRAADEEAPMHVWLAVIQDYPEMRSWVAHNKTVPLEILRRLAEDSSESVRSAVAEKRKLDTDLFRLLAADRSDGVRGRIAWNAKIPNEILVELTHDPDGFVAKTAREVLAKRLAQAERKGADGGSEEAEERKGERERERKEREDGKERRREAKRQYRNRQSGGTP